MLTMPEPFTIRTAFISCLSAKDYFPLICKADHLFADRINPHTLLAAQCSIRAIGYIVRRSGQRHHGLCKDCALLIRFCGITRMMPLRGLSMSAISMNESDTVSGMISKKRFLPVEFFTP